MQIREQMIPYQLLYPITDKYVKDEILFFDIETTGFSPETSYVYLIGCCYYKDNKYNLIQWFSESIEEEKQLIINFFDFISSYRLLVHYNGSSFDLPYLNHKLLSYQLTKRYKPIDSYDIYRQIIPYKKRLPLPNLKLKTIEKFCNIKRKDPYDGGQLIQIYLKYLAFHTLELKKVETSSLQPSKQSGLPVLGLGHAKDYLEPLLLHNAEDVANLLIVSSILSYVDLFQGNITVTNATSTDTELILQLTLPQCLPVPVRDRMELSCSYRPVNLLLDATDATATLHIPIFTGELKFFFENYKDYYYLPYEDTAVHKSVGEYVDKAYRQNAKAINCYIKKTGSFLPQKRSYQSPEFRFELKEKVTWFQIKEDFLTDFNKLTSYVKSLYDKVFPGIE